MKTKIPHHKISKAYQLILPAIAVIITISIIQYPDEAFNAALNGLDVWFTIVLPALLPFFIGSQLLMGLGVVHFMGVCWSPLCDLCLTFPVQALLSWPWALPADIL